MKVGLQKTETQIKTQTIYNNPPNSTQINQDQLRSTKINQDQTRPTWKKPAKTSPNWPRIIKTNIDQQRPITTNQDKLRLTKTDKDQPRPTRLTKTNQYRPGPTNIHKHQQKPTKVNHFDFWNGQWLGAYILYQSFCFIQKKICQIELFLAFLTKVGNLNICNRQPKKVDAFFFNVSQFKIWYCYISHIFEIQILNFLFSHWNPFRLSWYWLMCRKDFKW